MTPARILVTGSRTWSDPDIIFGALVDAWTSLDSPEQVVLVHGAAAGADRLAEAWTGTLGWTVERHPADWSRHGKRAGILRNIAMIDRGADICLAFIRDSSRGATSCAAMAERAGILVRRYFM